MTATKDAVLMTEPPPVSSRCGIPCLQHRKTDLRLTSCTRCHASSEVSSTEASSSGGDPGVVEQHVDAAELLAHLRVGVVHRVLVGDVGHDREVARGVGQQVDADDGRALVLEALDGRRADAAGGAGDDADLAREPAHPVA